MNLPRFNLPALEALVSNEGLRALLRNRYVVVGALALAWMLLFDRYDLSVHWRLDRKISQLQADRRFYRAEIARLSDERRLLMTSPAEAERLARERYLMKRPDEDLYVIVPGEK